VQEGQLSAQVLQTKALVLANGVRKKKKARQGPGAITKSLALPERYYMLEVTFCQAKSADCVKPLLKRPLFYLD